MKKYNRILFPTDFSTASENALKYAVNLAEELDADLDLISVYSIPAGLADAMTPQMIDDIAEQKKKNAEKKLRRLINDYCRNRKTKQRAIYGGFAAAEIAEYANDRGYDLIIMGTKGERSAFEKILGSVTTKTMLKASCPVLAIPAHAKFQKINFIAFATAYDQQDGEAALFTKDFALQVGAKMQVVHAEIQKREFEPTPNMTDYSVDFADFTLVEDKSIEEGLDSYIEERGVDILAMFIPKRSLWERLFHSSFTKKMTFHSKTPLLVFRGVQKTV